MNRPILVMLVCLAALYAGDVQVDTNGNLIVDAGTVRAANVLQLPLPTSTTTLGNTAALDAAAFGKWFLIGGPSNYDITLPSAVNNAGKCIGFRVLDATVASKTYTLKPATSTSEKIDGAADQALTASGSLVIMSDGTHWARVGGTSTGSGSGGTSAAVLTDEQAYAPVFQGFGTPTNVQCYWRRVGNVCRVRGRFTAPTTTAVEARIGLPAGLVVDAALLPATSKVGDAAREPITSNLNGISILAAGGNTFLNASWINNGNGLTPVTSNTILNSGDSLGFYAEVPIAGWTGSQVVQQGSRYLWAQRYAATATRVTTTPTALGQYRARRMTVDTAPATAPSQANGFRIDAGSGIAAGYINQYDIYVGTGKVVSRAFSKSTNRAGLIATDYHLVSGTGWMGALFAYDPTTGVVQVRCLTANAGDAVGYDPESGSYSALAYFDILVADDPVPVAMAPTVHVEASSDASQAVTAGVTPLQYEDEAVDTHGAWNGALFSAPVAGKYSVCAAVAIGASTNAIEVWQNGTLIRTGSYAGASTTESTISFTKSMSAGESLEFRSNNGGTRSSFAHRNWLSITRVGD